MTKKQKNISVVMLIWAGLFIVVLYSPIGSPNLYTSTNYYAINQGVNFANTDIPNATKVRIATDNANNDIPDMSGNRPGTTGSSVGSSPSATVSSLGSSYAVQSPSYLSNNSSGSAGGGGGVVMIGSGGSRGSGSAGSSGVTMTSGGITTLSSGYSSVKQSSTAQTLTTTGGTDPGGDPIGAPIPVGDGWGLFVFFGICYAVYKKRSFLKTKLIFSAQRK